MAEKDIERAKALLSADGSLTAVAVKGGDVISTCKKGVRPLVEWINAFDLKGWSVADRAGGRAAAMLYSLMGIDEAYFIRASAHCMDYLKGCGIKAECGELVDRILNADRSGMCPMEELSLEADSPETLLKDIRERLSR